MEAQQHNCHLPRILFGCLAESPAAPMTAGWISVSLLRGQLPTLLLVRYINTVTINCLTCKRRTNLELIQIPMRLLVSVMKAIVFAVALIQGIHAQQVVWGQCNVSDHLRILS